MAHSSTVEPIAHNGLVAGSIPAGPTIRIYNMGYKDCGAWFGYIPPRHKKRILKHIKEKNKGRRKDSYKRITLADMIEIRKFETVMYV